MIQALLTVFKRYTIEQKRVIVAGVTALVGVGFGLNFIVFADLSALHRYQALYQDEQKKQAAYSRLAVLRDQVLNFDPLLSRGRQIDWMMGAVQKNAAETGLSVTSISPQTPERDDNFEKFPLLLEAEGNYHQVGHFLAKIENFKPCIFLSHLRLEKNETLFKERRIKVFALFVCYRENSAGVS